MKAERFRQIRNLFEAALERPSDARNSFLQEACHNDEELLIEVGRLLVAHGEPTAWIDSSVLGQARPRLEGRQVGAYEILRQLGEGGMGTVYLATRSDDPDRAMVALKVVRPEVLAEEVLRRFKREREILESLDHPNIARVLDGGTTDDGLPYFVMDYVDGQPIDAYCDRNELDFNARLNLFRDVCAAVQYAHEHRVVHRDLKPANILVTRTGVVKLLDFGISKLATTGPEGATSLTRSDLLLMTPEYASPEQVSGLPVTPASDIYALGVVLYELLTGRRPYRLKSRVFREIVRVICEEAPTRPSTAVMQKEERPASPELKKLLSGNVDAIVLRTLEKDPAQRYRSARQFAEDLRLHLEGQAVEARQHQTAEIARRFLAASRLPVALLAMLALSIYGGVLVIPPGAVTALVAIGVVLVLAYPAGVYAVGRETTGRAYRNLVRIVPGAVVLGVAEVWLLLNIQNRSSTLMHFILVTPFLVVSAACFLGLQKWWRREDWGPVVLDLTSKHRMKLLWFNAVIQLLMGGMFAFVAWRKKDISLLFVALLLIIPIDLIIFTVRPEIRQRAFLGHPWTDIQSYTWKAGAGKLGERVDVLHLRIHSFWGFRKLEVGIPKEHRQKIQALLEQQLYEWPS
jgi:serine/threonine protein kinase